MKENCVRPVSRKHWALRLRMLLVGLSSVLVLGQAGVSHAQQDGEVIEEIAVVAKYSESLQRSIDLKRRSTAFLDSISAEDIGKFPELNLAEALQRVPGVQITRQNGEGQQIALRGLGPSFVRVVLNGTPMSIASTGGNDQFAANRELDFDIFPTELFNQVVVQKSPYASTVEGGIAGTLDLRNARPFDSPDGVLNASLKGQYSELSEEVNPRGHLVWSNTWNDTVGLLVGVAASTRDFRVDGFDTIDWTHGAVSGFSPSDGSRTGFTWNLDGGNASGLTLQQLADTQVPRLARPDLTLGTRDRLGVSIAAQWRPSDTVNLNLDYYYANLDQSFERYTNNMLIRGTGPGSFFGYVTPVDFTVNENNTLTNGTLQDVRYWAENRPYETDVDFQSVFFSGDWAIQDGVNLDWGISLNESDYSREVTTFLWLSDPTNTQFSIDGSLPVLTPNVDLSDASNWIDDFVRVQPVERDEENTSAFVNLVFGDEANNLKAGVFYHDFNRDHRDRFLGGSVQALYDQFGPGGPVSLEQLSQPSANVADWGTNFSATPGYTNWLIGDFSNITAAFDLPAMYAAAPISPLFSGETGEESFAAYVEANAETQVVGRTVRVNAGIRYIDREDLSRGWFVTESGDLAQNSFSASDRDYLPSLNLSMDLSDTLILRAAASRSMTRADPSLKEPRTQVAVATAAVRQGNPFLNPFYADQLDLGVEWYFADNSLLSANFFSKDIDGFTQLVTTQRPFGDAGIPLDALDPSVLAGLPDGLDTVVDFSTFINSPDKVSVDGLELLYQQPLDMVLPGLGFVINYTLAKDSGDRPLLGLSENSYNVIAFYEQNRFNIRFSLNHRDENATCDVPCRDGQPDANFRDTSTYLDFTAGIRLTENLTLSVDGLNLTEEEEFTYFGSPERMRTLAAVGRVFVVGLSGQW